MSGQVDAGLLRGGVEKVLEHKRNQRRLTEWFVYQELKMKARQELAAAGRDPDAPELQGELLRECVSRMPLSIPPGSAIAGSQDAAFSPSYALINPTFRVESFSGYCDPLAVYDDIAPDAEFPAERIEAVRSYFAASKYVRRLKRIYGRHESFTKEVAFFMEPVTGHTIPDVRPFLEKGIDAFGPILQAPAILAQRYAELAGRLAVERSADADEVVRLKAIAANCRQAPRLPAGNLHQAVQAFALLWQAMCLEQAPNPYAFSVGNLDRILQPYLLDTPADEAVQLVRHLLAFFMVGDRCWAISQNVMAGGKDVDGGDLSCPMTYAVMDAFFESNSPQPAFSVKVHRGTPGRVHQSLGRFFFTPGHSTPSLFNDDGVFELLKAKGVEAADLPDYAIAGCQEPLVMGKENGNTTNSWLNLAKVLEITLNDGKSLLSGAPVGLSWRELGHDGVDAVLDHLEEAFLRQLDHVLEAMRQAANECVEALGMVAAPLSSALHGCRDMRDPAAPGTKYNGSGCLVHGLGVLADSLQAVAALRRSGVATGAELLAALRADFEGHGRLREYLLAQDKYGNNLATVDALAARLAGLVCDKVAALRNPAGKPFSPDFSTPSTHLLYGHQTGATPDGRKAREALGYGIDPRPGAAVRGFQARVLSSKRLPFRKFTGGYASHLGLSPESFAGQSGLDAKAAALRERVVEPLFAFRRPAGDDPYYVYFNVDAASHLRAVLANPGKHAPTGVYIMRIHGTFVNFLDLSPSIQYDIIERLDPVSTTL